MLPAARDLRQYLSSCRVDIVGIEPSLLHRLALTLRALPYHGSDAVVMMVICRPGARKELLDGAIVLSNVRTLNTSQQNNRTHFWCPYLRYIVVSFARLLTCCPPQQLAKRIQVTSACKELLMLHELQCAYLVV